MILDFNVNIDSQLTSKANFLFGASTLILIFTLNKVFSPDFGPLIDQARTAWITLLVGSFLSSLTAIMIVLPRIRIFSTKERVRKDVIYYKNIRSFYSRKMYIECLKDMPSDSGRIGRTYANQVYSLASDMIPYKFRLLKLSGWVLIISIVLSVAMFLVLLNPRL